MNMKTVLGSFWRLAPSRLPLILVLLLAGARSAAPLPAQDPEPRSEPERGMPHQRGQGHPHRVEREQLREVLRRMPPERRAQILERMRGLETEERRRMWRRIREYSGVTHDERSELRRRHDHLRGWLRALPPEERAQLRDLPPHERRKRLRERVDQICERYRNSLGPGERTRFDALPPRDRRRHVLDELRKDRPTGEQVSVGPPPPPVPPSERPPRPRWQERAERLLDRLSNADLEAIRAWQPGEKFPIGEQVLPARARERLEGLSPEERARWVDRQVERRRGGRLPPPEGRMHPPPPDEHRPGPPPDRVGGERDAPAQDLPPRADNSTVR